MKKPSKKEMQDFEKTSLDKKVDKATGFKEGSKKDQALDKVLIKARKKKNK